MSRIPGTVLGLLLSTGLLFAQDKPGTVIKGTVSDGETGAPLTGAHITLKDSNPPQGTISDESGKFVLNTHIGRISLKITFIGYDDCYISDILAGSGKEIFIPVKMREAVITTGDVVVRPAASSPISVNPMASVSTNTIRTDDALRYAGGFYDPSRIVNSFAGIVASNSDYSNDIVIRGNSSRGLLWRLEGIEIPNPNHFSDGQGGSGGAFSAITSNVIDNFDFFTGAFPSEFGNAFSGVMDLNLRKGNPDKYEFAFQTGMIGAELSAEGPLFQKGNSSFLINTRYTNFKILSNLGIIDLGETNFAPRTSDVVYNIVLPSKKSGTFNLFGMAGSSMLGKIAETDIYKWTSLSDQWEEMEKQSSGIAGIKHFILLPGNRTSVKSVASYSNYNNSFREGFVDMSLNQQTSYSYNYRFPSLRISSLINHKLNAANTFRSGIIVSKLNGEMEHLRLTSPGIYDTLVKPRGSAMLYQGYMQWKHRVGSSVDINTGFHIIGFSLNDQLSFEPRAGIRYNFSPGNAFTAGIGFHSRIESLVVYNTLIKTSDGKRELLNRLTGFSRSFHAVGGLDLTPAASQRLRIEGYIQYLYQIPVVNKITSQYSTLNSAERLPDAPLENTGTGRNSGLDITLDRSYKRNYYYLITGSFFNSWYEAGDTRRYNTYYNTGHAFSILAGKDIYSGKYKENIISINVKQVVRGGYRYTPVNEEKSLKAKRIIYNTSLTYEKQLPEYYRLDAGISFRRNRDNFCWIVMLDIQNLTDRKNVFRRRFNYSGGKIITTDILSLGIVPVFNFRIEF